jgi:hypothetical protein
MPNMLELALSCTSAHCRLHPISLQYEDGKCTMSSAAGASDSFVEFIGTYSDVSDGDDWSQYFQAWLEQGNAVLETGGDFGCYMQCVLFTVARYQQDPSILDYNSGKPDYQRRRARGYFPDLGGPRNVIELGSRFTHASAFQSDHYRVIYAYRLAGVANPWQES